MDKKRNRSRISGKRIVFIADTVLLVVFGVYLLYRVQNTLTFRLRLETWTEPVLMILVLSASAFRATVMLAVHRHEKTFLLRTMLPAALAAVLWILVYFNDMTRAIPVDETNRYRFLVFLGALTLGFAGIGYRKVLRVFLLTVGISVGAGLLCGVGGLIPDLIYRSPTGALRSSLGISYPTDLASYILFLALFAWIFFTSVPDAAFLVPGGISLIVSYFFARSSTGILCSICFLALVLFKMLFLRKSSGKAAAFGTRCLKISTWLFPIFAVVMMFLVWSYSRGYSFAVEANRLITNRLDLSLEAYRNYGIRLLGSPLPQAGNGMSTLLPTSDNYNFVDSSYMLILLRYGILCLIYVTVVWVLMSREAIRKKDYRLALGMALIAFHSVTEHHFTEMNYNVLIVLPFSVLAARQALAPAFAFGRGEDISGAESAVSTETASGTETVVSTETASGTETAVSTKTAISAEPAGRNKSGKRRHLSPGAIGALVAIAAMILIVILAPGFFSRFRTIGEMAQITKTFGRRGLLFILSMLLICMILLLLLSIQKLICQVMNGRRCLLCTGIIAAVLAVFLAAGICSEILIRRGVVNRSSSIEPDRETLELITDTIERKGTGKLYAGCFPELYKRSIPGFSDNVLYKEEVARCRDATVLMNKKEDSSILFFKGFQYAPISEKRAVYSNDPEVLQALTQAGVQVTPYYPIPYNVNLKKEAELNDLKMDEDGALLLEGGEHCVDLGPYAKMYGGAYLVTYDLSLDTEPEPSAAQDQTVAEEPTAGQNQAEAEEPPAAQDQAATTQICQLVITTVSGQYTVQERILTMDQFDQDGHCTAEMKITIPDSVGVEFKCYPAEGQKLRLQSITWEHTMPDDGEAAGGA